MKLRPATEHDIRNLLRLEQEAFDSDRFTEDRIDYLVHRSRAAVFVLGDGADLCGAAYLLFRKAHRVARLYNLAVNPRLQGRGLGARLLNECELEAARRDCQTITLEVRQDNVNAIQFYERHGFKAIRTLADYYEDGAPGLKMAKKLRRSVPAKIRLRIPYYAQTLDFTCGPACIMMVLKYFYPDIETGRALEMRLWKEATLIFTASGFGGTGAYGLALAGLTRGLGCRLITSMETTPLLKSVRIKEKRDIIAVVHGDMKRRARRAGVASSIYEYGIEEIISALHRGMVPVALISTYRLTGDRVPHWVVITGFDKDNLFVHDPDAESYRRDKSRARNLPVEKSEFLRMSRYGKEVYRCILMFDDKPPVSVSDMSPYSGRKTARQSQTGDKRPRG